MAGGVASRTVVHTVIQYMYDIQPVVVPVHPWFSTTLDTSKGSDTFLHSPFGSKNTPKQNGSVYVHYAHQIWSIEGSEERIPPTHG